MITSAIIPRPLARLPWRLIFMTAGIALFGLVVLYSAAGGSMHPWAIKQAIVFLAFLVIARLTVRAQQVHRVAPVQQEVAARVEAPAVSPTATCPSRSP